jgi:DNA end-binding protein Ku
MLHAEDHTPIRYERKREDDGKEVPWKDVVKGYKLPDGDYVVLTDRDFKEAAVEQTKTIDILDFVDGDELDPRFFETSYFLVPGKGGERAYALLREAMRETNTLGIGKIILHRKQHLAAMRVLGEGLEIVLMRFAAELVDPSEYSFPAKSDVRPEELKMAKQLVENLRAPFDAEKYVDEYSENLLRIINAKAKGKRVSLEGPAHATREPKVLDLMARLQESLAQARRAEGGAEAETSRSKRGRAARGAAASTRARRRKSA